MIVSHEFMRQSYRIRKLGRGSYGNVDLIQTPKGKYALKRQKLHKGVTPGILNDINALIYLEDVPEVIQLEGIHWSNTYVSMLLEAMDMDLTDYIWQTPKKERLKYFPYLFRMLARLLTVFEARNINHFDIKPGNILVEDISNVSGDSDIRLKLTDFGLSRISYDDKFVPESHAFTLWYRPPEFLIDRDRYEFSPHAGDVWAAGLTLVEFIIGKPLFREDTRRETLKQIHRYSNSSLHFKDFYDDVYYGDISGYVKLKDLIGPYVTSSYIDLLELMLMLDPKDRPRGSQIARILEQTVDIYDPPSEIPRTISMSGIDNILKISIRLNISRASTLIAIEIFTRYLAILTQDIPNSFVIDLAIIHIAIMFNENQDIGIRDILRKGSIYENISVRDVIKTEKRILKAINFNVYHPEIHRVIMRAYRKGIRKSLLQEKNKLEWKQPMTAWLR